MDDITAWCLASTDDLWVFDKLLLSKKLGYRCGPKGVPVPKPGIYVVRPITNLLGMGIGAYFCYLEHATTSIPDGYFWCEKFSGRHLSVDYVNGTQVLCVEGFRNSRNPLWKWSRWRKTKDKFVLPAIIKELASKHTYLNIEAIGGKIIEVHFRTNPDWDKDYSEIIPVFEGDTIIGIEGYTYKESPDHFRKGFYVKE